jgi:hypothetical protein
MKSGEKMTKSMVETVKLSDIDISGGTQQREKINNEIVSEYAEAMRCGAKFPPVRLFFDGVTYWLADGFHRFHARKEADIPDIDAMIVSGSVREAQLYSTGANNDHGIRLTNADKRKSVMVMLSDKEWSGWSDNSIAKHCKVTHPYVGKLRGEMADALGLKVVTVTTPPSKPLNTEEEKNGKRTESADSQTESEPEYTELDEAKDTIIELQNALVVQNMDGSDEEKEQAKELIERLRAEIKMLRASEAALKVSRDNFQAQVAELKKQIQRQRREIDKLTGGKTA